MVDLLYRLALALLLISPTWSCAQGDEEDLARYSISFESHWSQGGHGNLPNTAHWSRLVGATHDHTVEFVKAGTLASPGIKDIAEKGQNSVFFEEVQAAINAKQAYLKIDGPSLNTADGLIEISSVEVSKNYPLLSLVSMIAPSPDWIIAVDGVSLIDQGTWIDEVVVDLYPYDAGTDSGLNYTSANSNTDPAEPIKSLENVSPFSQQRIGTLRITLDATLTSTNTSQALIKIHPNPVLDYLTIESEHKDPLDIKLYTVDGQEVIGAVLNNRQNLVDISNLENGVYMVQIKTADNRLLIRRLVKQ